MSKLKAPQLLQTPTAKLTSAPSGILQRKCASCANHTVAGDKCGECRDQEGALQRKSSSSAGFSEAPPIVSEVLNSSGQPLDKSVRAFFEPRFGGDFSKVPVKSASGPPSYSRLTIGEPADVYEREADRVADSVMQKQKHENKTSTTDERQGEMLDLSRVRIHTDARAAESARAVNALAYTVGNNIVFGAGQFSPTTNKGQRLIAHELTHVLQQTGGAKNNVTGQPSILKMSGHQVMRSIALDSTIKICHRVLTSRNINISKGGLRVVLLMPAHDKGIPNCQSHKFWVTLTRSVDWGFDDEIATCEGQSGGNRSFSYANLSNGTYYLTIHRVFDHPYCCLEGDILAFDEPVTGDSTECTRDTDPTVMDIVHGALDIAGFIPALGAIPDGINAAIYVAEGDWANAGLSAVAMVPLWGDGVKLGAVAGKSAIKISEKAAVRMGKEGIAKGLKEVKAASQAEKLTAEAVQQAEKQLAEKGSRELADDVAKAGSKEVSDDALRLIIQVFRKGDKFKSVGAVSLKRLRNVLGRAGVSPSEYSLVKVSKEVAQKMEKSTGESIWGWVSRTGDGKIIRDAKGRPIINFTPRALSSLEEAVKTFGHEAKHIEDFAKGLLESSEALAEKAGEKLWLVVKESLEK